MNMNTADGDDAPSIATPYHTGQHTDCASCRLVTIIEAQEARIAALEAALQRARQDVERASESANYQRYLDRAIETIDAAAREKGADA